MRIKRLHFPAILSASNAPSHTNAAAEAPSPFDHPDWMFELKYDGFRALALLRDGGVRLISRNGHPFGSFGDLGKHIAKTLTGVTDTVLDGEIVCVDSTGRPQFTDLMFHRGDPCFFAFDLPIRHRKDERSHQRQDRKQELRRLLARVAANSPLKYADHVDGSGIAPGAFATSISKALSPSSGRHLTSRSVTAVRGSKF